MKNSQPNISLIIPAHNEAENIGRVLQIVTKAPELKEIIVVADACQDNTAEVAKNFGVKVIIRPTSQGKGSAMIEGFKHASGDIIMFADADLENLTLEHVRQILAPVTSGQAVMSVGLRDRVLGLGAVIPKLLPMYAIGGERAMTRDFFNALPQDQNILDFGIETVMNYYAKKHGLPVATTVLKNLHQVIKEKKWGFWPGLKWRFKLTHQVWRTRHLMKRKQNL
jgi:hypothetical protein